MGAQGLFASRLKHGIWRVGSPFRFVFWGGVTAVACYSIYAVLLLFLPYMVSYFIAYVAGIPISYFLNSKFVFVQPMKLGKALRYPLVYVAHYLLGTTCLYVLVQWLDINKLVAPVIVMLVTIPVNFLLVRKVVRPRVPKPSNSQANS